MATLKLSLNGTDIRQYLHARYIPNSPTSPKTYAYLLLCLLRLHLVLLRSQSHLSLSDTRSKAFLLLVSQPIRPLLCCFQSFGTFRTPSDQATNRSRTPPASRKHPSSQLLRSLSPKRIRDLSPADLGAIIPLLGINVPPYTDEADLRDVIPVLLSDNPTDGPFRGRIVSPF